MIFHKSWKYLDLNRIYILVLYIVKYRNEAIFQSLFHILIRMIIQYYFNLWGDNYFLDFVLFLLVCGSYLSSIALVNAFVKIESNKNMNDGKYNRSSSKKS